MPISEVIEGKKCVACEGSGKNSRGNTCKPCHGTGRPLEAAPITPRPPPTQQPPTKDSGTPAQSKRVEQLEADLRQVADRAAALTDELKRVKNERDECARLAEQAFDQAAQWKDAYARDTVSKVSIRNAMTDCVWIGFTAEENRPRAFGSEALIEALVNKGVIRPSWAALKIEHPEIT